MTPWDELLALHRSGRLAAEFDRVVRLVGELPGTDLVRAGRLLARLDPDDIAREHPNLPRLAVAVTGHGTLTPLVPALTGELVRHRLVPRLVLSDFDSYVFDLADPGSALYAAGAGLTLCLLDPMVVFDEVATPWRPEDVERVLADKLGLIERLVDRHHATAGTTLVLNTMPLPRRFTAQLVDHRSRARLGAAWREANARLLRLTTDRPNLVVLDLDPLTADGTAAVDWRLSQYAKAHLSPDLLSRYARDVGHLARNLTGATKKVLALDLDGTVWGGVLGEDGADGIEVADGYRGEAFRAFQRTVKQLGDQGVLVTAVSKNELEPVRAVLRTHAGMTLREQDFVRVVANWRPKPDNLTELASALNLGVDSFVFVDDSAHECGLVRHALSDVAVVQLGEEPVEHIGRLLRDGWFDTRELTAEDRTRVEKYQQEQSREDFLGTFDSLADYLRELRVKVRFATAGEPDVPRLSQVTLRTNQFNLTTIRLQPEDVRARLADPAADVLAIEASDRFGDSGVVGAVFTRRRRDELHIENFLLSCRAFSRGIESACLAALLRHARATHASAVLGEYRPTAKNGMVADFYPHHGFVADTAVGPATTFRHDLAELFAPPDHIELTVGIGGPDS